MAPMALSDSEVKTCSKTCLKNYEDLKSKYDKLRVELNKSESDLYNYKRGLASVEERLVFYKKNEGMLCDQIDVLKRDASYNESDINALKKQVERLKKEKEDNQFKIDNFENASKSLDKLIGNQISDKNKKGLEYNVVPPPPTGLFAPPIIDLSHSGIEKFKEPEFKGYGPENNKKESNEWVSDNEDEVESPVVVEKKIVPKVDVVKSKQQEKPVRKPVKYAEMYRSQKPRVNQRNWNNLKSQQLGSDFVMIKKACYVQKPIWNNARRVNHHNSHRMSYPHPKINFVPKEVLMKTGMRPVNAAKPKAAYNAVKRNRFNDVKASTCWVWMPKNRVIDHARKIDLINEDHFCSNGCTGLGEARVQQRNRRIQIRVQQKQKDQEDEVFGRILSAKKMKITAVGEKVNAAESLLVVSTEVNAN
ncbi:hypothetical protein Tco_0569866 [Tanacetum coccineum]